MKLEVQRQNSYSRVHLLLRSFFGLFYIGIPHGIILLFLQLWSAILMMLAWWVILFTGRYPRSWFDYQIKLRRYALRLGLTMSNMRDEYPAFGLDTQVPYLTFEVEYPPTLSRGLLLLKSFFGIFYVMIPHGIVLLLRGIVGAILGILAWWVILFTGHYPESWFNFQVATERWSTRVWLYMSYLSDNYPPFSGE